MKQLQKTVFRNFIVAVLLLSLAVSITDSISNMFVEPRLETPLQFALFIALNLTLDISFVALAAYLFWRQTKKAFEIENNRQREEQNLLYSSIVHDIKTPMTSVKGYTRALVDGKVKKDDETNVLKLIDRKSDQVTMLLDELFLYTNLSSGIPQMHKERADIVALVQEVISDCYDLAQANGIILDFDIPQTPLYAQVSKKEMRRLVSNLFQNAIKHNKLGTIIQFRIRECDKYIEIAIADDGEKIPKAVQDKLFKPFVKQDDSRSSEGSGLGLAIADSIAKAHGASIEIADDYNGYSKAFVINLPSK